MVFIKHVKKQTVYKFKNVGVIYVPIPDIQVILREKFKEKFTSIWTYFILIFIYIIN